jgi:hypothetical protein
MLSHKEQKSQIKELVKIHGPISGIKDLRKLLWICWSFDQMLETKLNVNNV